VFLAHQKGEGEPTRNVQAKENDQHPASLANEELIIKQELPESRRRSAEGDGCFSR